jgi:hypothetical protein
VSRTNCFPLRIYTANSKTTTHGRAEGKTNQLHAPLRHAPRIRMCARPRVSSVPCARGKFHEHCPETPAPPLMGKFLAVLASGEGPT